MTEDKRTINCDITALDWLKERIANAKFCTQECPVPQNERNCSCGCRPLVHMTECTTLKRYNKKGGIKMKLLELTKVECDFLLKLLAEWALKTKTTLEAQDNSLALSLTERLEETEDD